MKPISIWVAVTTVEQGWVSLGHTGSNKGTGNNLEIFSNICMFLFEGNLVNKRLTKNFMVDDDTALIYGIQLIPGLESSTPFIGSHRLIIVLTRPGARPLPRHCPAAAATYLPACRGATVNRHHFSSQLFSTSEVTRQYIVHSSILHQGKNLNYLVVMVLSRIWTFSEHPIQFQSILNIAIRFWWW